MYSGTSDSEPSEIGTQYNGPLYKGHSSIKNLFPYRLVSSSGTIAGSSGRLEIFYSGQWGTVCDDNFLLTEANVACVEQGYVGASNYGSALLSG